MVNVKAQLATINETIKTQVNDKVSDIMDDKREIERRKMNLIVFGLPESKPDENDKTVWDTEKKIQKDIEEITNIQVKLLQSHEAERVKKETNIVKGIKKNTKEQKDEGYHWTLERWSWKYRKWT